jgi:adenine deaminase
MDAEMQRAMAVALGNAHADSVITGGRLVNVHTAEVNEADVAISGRYIAYVGDAQHCVGPETELVDAAGRYLVPGLIETHQHVGGTHLSMTEFGKMVIPHGTVAIVTDFYEPGSVAGKEGVRFCLDELKATGIEVIFGIPVVSHFQNNPFNNIDSVTVADLKEMLSWSDCYGFNELVVAQLADGEPTITEITEKTRELGKILVSHGAETPMRKLQAALIATGPTSDHEPISAEEAAEKARLGMHILIREGSAATDLVRVVKAITEMGLDPRMFAFSTDEESAHRMMHLGHVDRKIRMAVIEGVSAVTAVQMATLNAAQASGVADKLGSIVPGKWASILLIDDLDEFTISEVILNGRRVARDGEMVVDLEPPTYPHKFMNTVNVGVPIRPDSFHIAAPGGAHDAKVRVIGAQPGVLASKELIESMPVVNGQIPPQPDRDILKISVIDRHQATGRIAVAFINGFQLRSGAIGSVYNPCVEDMVILGTNERDMAMVANKLIENQGGFVVVENGQVKALMETPLFGVLSVDPVETMIAKSQAVDDAVAELGCPLQAPFHTLAFMAWPGHFGILKMSNAGLANVNNGQLVNVVVES